MKAGRNPPTKRSFVVLVFVGDNGYASDTPTGLRLVSDGPGTRETDGVALMRQWP